MQGLFKYAILERHHDPNQQSLSFIACTSTRIQAEYQERIRQSIVIVASLCIDISKYPINSNESRITRVSVGTSKWEKGIGINSR